ncbi:kinase-like protein [Gigaspora margarita]|uniref:Kinase-like protein n=1 Tax=Gigaspora margarita TaxID=4874 RepID=A0A8H3XF82_GIGMA|nr:kinase-like protein [Gigaspora margarita]
MLVLQFANGGNLRDYLSNSFNDLKWEDKFRMAKEIAQALLYLHNKDIIHRDLHSKNILVHEGKMLLADFGLARYINDDPTISDNIIGGMPAYIEPQCFKNPSYIRNKKSDIYSFGVILWELSSGKQPFQSFTSIEAIAIHVFQGHREKPVDDTPIQYAELYMQCWDDNPEKRPEMKAVLDKLNQMISKPVNFNRSDTTIISMDSFDRAISTQNIKFIDYNQFKRNEYKIGSVHKYTWQRTELTTVVFKRFDIDPKLDENVIQEFVYELKSLQRLSFHQNINHFYGITKDADNGCYMTVQQFANGESLREYLKNNFENLNWDDKLLIAKDIAQGLVFLHHNNKIHKNLHSRNVLIHEGRAVLTDLDWKRPLVAETSVSDTQTDRQPAFTDPQFFRNYTYKWHREKPVEGTQSQYVKLYEQCWDDDPDKRPEMRIVLDKLNHLNQFYATSLSIKNENPLNRLLEEAIAEQHLNFHNYNEFSGFENIDSKDLGSAYKTAWRNRGIKVTLKCFKNNNGDLDKQIIQLKNLQKINFHPNIIEFYGVTKDPNGNYYMSLS